MAEAARQRARLAAPTIFGHFGLLCGRCGDRSLIGQSQRSPFHLISTACRVERSEDAFRKFTWKGDDVLLIDDFLDEDQCARLRQRILNAPFVSGSSTAGGMAASVKKNLQLDERKSGKIIDEVKSLILAHPEIDLFAMPEKLVGVMVNRYDEGMEYGNHSDAPIMEGVRCDLSFTLFLEDHSNYDGGELMLEQEHGLLKVKPKIGSIFVYSTGLMHRVTKVTRGSRLACVGWIKSRIREEGRRKVLRDLNAVLGAYMEKNGHDTVADLQLKIIGDLIRMWHE